MTIPAPKSTTPRRPQALARGFGTLILALPLLFAAACGGEMAPPLDDRLGEISVVDRYIVVLKDEAMGGRGEQSRAPQAAERLAREHRARVKHVYTHALNGFTCQMSVDDMRRLRNDPEVRYVEPDGIVTIQGTRQQDDPPSWGLARIGKRKALNPMPPYPPFTYPATAGAGISVYVVDTGIDHSQPDFGGRAETVRSFVPGEANTDLNGHGTHVAGIIGAKTYGVAKKVSLFGVKVLNQFGSGTWSDVIAGVDYVMKQAKAVGPGTTVMNLSIGGDKTQAVDDAITEAFEAGVVTIVAAGNNGGDACQLSPAGAAGAFAVGATNIIDTIASISSQGQCVKEFAPGIGILSLWKGADGTTNTISGTSMAAAHVAGVAANFMSEKSYTSPQQVYDDLISSSTKDVLNNVGSLSPNALAFSRNIAN